MIDGGINRLVTLDGIVRVRGTNERLVKLIREQLMPSIPVNDNEKGLQAFYASQGNEIYEQGFSVGECVMDKRGRELVGLRVADSKGVAFRRVDGVLRTYYRPPSPRRGGRRDGTDEVETVLRNQGMAALPNSVQHEFVELPADRLLYATYQSEASNPYGTSIIRSVEFVSQILLRIHNATGHVWDRFGDPPMQLTYKTKGARLQQGELDKRRDKLAGELQRVLNAKRSGNSADFVQAIGPDDTIEVKVIGGDAKPLEIEMPARHMVEQILAKFGLPSWMLGVQWSTAERMADQQSEMALQESRTRFERRLPGLTAIVETWLRGRGETWSPGDWQLHQELPSLRDEVKRAQADFLRAQTALMRSGAGLPTDKTVPDDDDDIPDDEIAKMFRVEHNGAITFMRQRSTRNTRGKRRKAAHDDDDDEGEPWAEPDPALPEIERRAVEGSLALWHRFRDDVFAILGLPGGEVKDVGPTWRYDALAMLSRLLETLDTYIASATDVDGPLLREMFAAWVRGMENAVAGTGAAAAVEAARANMVAQMGTRVATYVPAAAIRSFTADILAKLQEGVFDGRNPKDVARQLRKRFGAHDYDWERLARSEIARAQGMGKLDQYRRMGATHVNLVTSPDACKHCKWLAESNPHPIDQAPIIVDDTHPHCRCSYSAEII